MRKLFLIILLLYSATSAAQDNPQNIIDKFFDLYKNKNSDAALDYIFGTNKWMNESKDQIENVKFKLNSTVKQIGQYEGFNLITKKAIGEHLTLYTFLVKHDRQPLRFSLLFYKPNSEWRLHNFSYDDNMDEELTEASKAYRLKENLDY